MNPRAVLCDIYNTLLEVGPPPADAEARWRVLCAASLGGSACLSVEAFAVATGQIIAQEHEAARARGIAFPEVYWPEVAVTALPELGRLTPAQLDDFLFAHAQLQRTVRLLPGVGAALLALAQTGVRLGLVSNCQPYTLRELDEGFANAGLSRERFSPALCFYSFAAGFSKPDPHVFRWCAARLRTLGITPAETLIVGDRFDNDIVPAQAQGFATWQITSSPSPDAGSGPWEALRQRLLPALTRSRSGM
jgi:FMN phosphatase YigB (HAD superfamily)